MDQTIGSVALYLASVNGATLMAYGYDKFAAKSRLRRIPERVLHRLELAGGTPAAWLGQRIFRHKTIKPEYQTRFWTIVAAQLAALAAIVGAWIFR